MTLIISDRGWQISSGAYDATSFAVSLLFSILFIHKLCSRSAKGIEWSMRLSSVIYVLSYCIRYFQAAVFHILPDDATLQRIDDIFGASGFIVAHTAFYCILLLRLWFAFSETMFELSRPKL